MFWRKKVIFIPEIYEDIERRIRLENGEYIISTDRVVLRNAQEIEVGGLRRKIPIYETRTEQTLIRPYTNTDEETPDWARYKYSTKEVICGYKYEYCIDDYSKKRFKEAFSFENTEKTFKFGLLAVLRFFLPSEYCEPLIGDVLEEYEYKSQYFKKFTVFWLLKEVVFTLSDIGLDWFIKKIPVSFKIGN